MNRRMFLASASTPLLAQVAAPAPTAALIGAGGRGRFLIEVFRRQGAQFSGVCDVYEPNLEAGLSAAGSQAKAYRNYRAVLDNKAIPIVVIATPEHWHHRMLLDALAAGKDVYVEKPICQTPQQGRELVAAAKASKSIVQVGMQRRSYPMYVAARDIVQSGKAGTVRVVRSWWVNNSLAASSRKLGGPLDWDQWQGPAAKRPLEPERFLNWRNYSEYSGGIVADQGAHVFDGIHMLMNAGYVSAVNASAGKQHQKAGDTPESVVVIAEYPQDFIAVFTINYAGMKYKTVNDQLNSYDGDQARLDVARERYTLYPQGAEETPTLTGTGDFGKATDIHVRNFLDCVQSRQTPNGTVERAFQAALVTQLANQSLKEGKRIVWS